MKKYQFKPYVVLFVLLIAFTFSSVLADDMIGMVAGTSPITDAYMALSVDVFSDESYDQNNDEGWGFMAWDLNYDPVYFHTTTDIWLDVIPYTNAIWEGTYNVETPKLFIAHSRNSSEYTAIPDPLPFTYKLNGRTLCTTFDGDLDSASVDYIHNVLLKSEYNGLQLLRRYFDTNSDRLSGEVFTKYLIKNVLLADNYNLGDEWAINRTFVMTQDTLNYNSLNTLFANGKDIYAVRVANTEANHRLWTRSFDANSHAIASEDDEIEMIGWDEVTNGYYTAAKRTGIMAESALDITNCQAPAYKDYMLDEYPDPTGINSGSEYVKVASSCKGYYCAVWKEGSAIKARVTNPLGLAEQLELTVAGANLNYYVHPNVCGDPEENMFYVVYAKAGPLSARIDKICVREITQELFYDEGTYFTPIYKWVVGEERTVNAAVAMREVVDYPAIASEGIKQIVVWQSKYSTDIAHRIRVREISSRGMDPQQIIITPDSTDCIKPDIAHLYGEQGVAPVCSRYAIAWKQNNGLQTTWGIGASYYANYANIHPAAIPSELIVPITNATHASFAYPAVYGTRHSWIVSWKSPYNRTNYHVKTNRYYSDPTNVPPNPNGVQVGDPWYWPMENTSIANYYPIVGDYVDNHTDDNGGHRVVYSAIPMTGNRSRIYLYTCTMFSIGTSLIDNNPNSTYPALYPDMAFENDEGGKRRLIAWEKQWVFGEGRKITANFSPWHFRNGAFKQIAGPMKQESGLPTDYALENAYPNPFNPSTTISYVLPDVADVNISVYNVQGQLVKALVHDSKSAGRHHVVFEGHNLSSGVYFVRMQAGNFVQSRKIILMK